MADTQSYLNRQFDCAVRIWILMQVCRNPSLGSVHILGLHLFYCLRLNTLMLLAAGQAWQKISEESPGDNNQLARWLALIP